MTSRYWRNKNRAAIIKVAALFYIYKVVAISFAASFPYVPAFLFFLALATIPCEKA